MKNIKSAVLLFLSVSFLFISCNQDEITQKEEPLNIDFSDTNFNFMNEEFFFEGNKEKMISDFTNKLESTLFNKSLFIDEDDKGIIKWEVSFSKNKIFVKQKIESITENIDQRGFIAIGYCPSGLIEYGKCSGFSTEKCTKKKAGELASNLKKGETFSVTRTGLASTVICGSKSLVDRTLKNQQ